MVVGAADKWRQNRIKRIDTIHRKSPIKLESSYISMMNSTSINNPKVDMLLEEDHDVQIPIHVHSINIMFYIEKIYKKNFGGGWKGKARSVLADGKLGVSTAVLCE
ncbi:hypothetical protein PDL03_19165 [Bacillus cereus]|nr:hypothetical protein [Bacillus cereus]HDX9713517.1 hypothetical protein [Bacillus cereus]